METYGKIYIVPGFGQGHIFPSMELCKHLASRNYNITLIIHSNLSSSVPSALRHHPLVEIAEISDAPLPEAAAGSGPGPHPLHLRHQQMGREIASFLSTQVIDPNRPVCAVNDFLMGCSEEFVKVGIATAAFFTSGGCSAAMEFGSWKDKMDDLKPDEIRVIPGLPEDMALTYLDLKQRPHGPKPTGPSGPPGPPGSRVEKFGPLTPGNRPLWVDVVDNSMGLLINTSDDLEHPFIDFLANKIGKPVWGVGPLLPEQYWKSSGSVLLDGEIRPKRQSNYTEDEVMQWLDSKPRASVIYVSFGSEVGPTVDEYGRLADASADCKWPFIWVIQPGAGRSGPSGEPGYYPHGLDRRVGDRGLIIHGWAPQMMILSHPSTGGFLSHCGWNSTVEAIGRGVPILAWPIRGDQYYNAKLVVKHLKVGYMVSNGDLSEMVLKEDIVEGIEKLMIDEEVHKRASELGGKFALGFPASSLAALDAFEDFVKRRPIP